MSEFILDDEIRQHMFAPDAMCDEELEQALLQSGGPWDKLIVGELPDEKRYLVDGYRRHTVCVKHHLPFAVDVRYFPSRTAIFDFMDSLQLARRNLNPNQLALIRGRRKTRHEANGCVRAAEETAEQHNVSARTVYRDAKYAEAVASIAPPLRDRVVEELSQAQTIELAKLPKLKQAKALDKKETLRAEKPDKTFDDYRKLAGKLCAQLQNSLADVHKAKADAIRLRTAKGHVKAAGETLDHWAEGYKE
jgi:hypothetical protein